MNRPVYNPTRWVAPENDYEGRDEEEREDYERQLAEWEEYMNERAEAEAEERHLSSCRNRGMYA